MSKTTTPQTRKKGGVLDGLVRPFEIASAALLTGFAGFQIVLAVLSAFVAHRGPGVGKRFGADAPGAEIYRDLREGV